MSRKPGPRRMAKPSPKAAPRKRALPFMMPPPDLPLDENDDESPLDEVQEPNQHDEGIDGDPEDDSEAGEAEQGIEDPQQADETPSEPSTRPANEKDADESWLEPGSYPAVALFPQPEGDIGYVVSEWMSGAAWSRADGLARFLIQQAGGRNWPELQALRKACRLGQVAYIRYLGGKRQHPKERVSEFLRRTTVSLDGEYVAAISFFRENVERTANGRARARQLIAEGRRLSEIRVALEAEFSAKRTTVMGWIKWAEKSAL